jgi:hypothetical protein
MLYKKREKKGLVGSSVPVKSPNFQRTEKQVEGRSMYLGVCVVQEEERTGT